MTSSRFVNAISSNFPFQMLDADGDGFIGVDDLVHFFQVCSIMMIITFQTQQATSVQTEPV
jgi:Ca2+-binding EF-hand superfamily protein